MHNIFGEEILDSFDNLIHNADGGYLLNPAMFVDKSLQVPMWAILCDDVPVCEGSVDFQTLDDVRVV